MAYICGVVLAVVLCAIGAITVVDIVIDNIRDWWRKRKEKQKQNKETYTFTSEDLPLEEKVKEQVDRYNRPVRFFRIVDPKPDQLVPVYYGYMEVEGPVATYIEGWVYHYGTKLYYRQSYNSISADPKYPTTAVNITLGAYTDPVLTFDLYAVLMGRWEGVNKYKSPLTEEEWQRLPYPKTSPVRIYRMEAPPKQA